MEMTADYYPKGKPKNEDTGSKSFCNGGLSANEVWLIERMIKDQEKRVIYCEKILRGKFGRFQKQHALDSIELLDKILNKCR